MSSAPIYCSFWKHRARDLRWANPNRMKLRIVHAINCLLSIEDYFIIFIIIIIELMITWARKDMFCCFN
jgi:hypothetical protein